MMEEVLVVTTGGTIEKKYCVPKGVMNFQGGSVRQMLERGLRIEPPELVSLMLVDSSEMTDSQRQEILQICHDTSKKQIVITHGTDTMAQTARFLHQHIKDKTIVLTGAMVSYVLKGSDALFNLGTAIAFAQSLAVGVYVAMNGQFFKAEEAFKDKSAGIFRKTSK